MSASATAISPRPSLPKNFLKASRVLRLQPMNLPIWRALQPSFMCVAKRGPAEISGTMENHRRKLGTDWVVTIGNQEFRGDGET